MSVVKEWRRMTERIKTLEGELAEKMVEIETLTRRYNEMVELNPHIQTNKHREVDAKGTD